MAVTKLTMSGFTPSTFNKYDDFLAGNAAYDPAATFLIQRITATGSESTITFSSIPQTYKHLQLRVITSDTAGGSVAGTVNLRLNGATSGYAYHNLDGDGSSASAGGVTSVSSVLYIPSPYAGNTNIRGVGIVDIHDYASTTKNKTLRAMNGWDKNGSGYISLQSGLYPSTTAVTSLSLLAAATAFSSGSTFALYGFTG